MYNFCHRSIEMRENNQLKIILFKTLIYVSRIKTYDNNIELTFSKTTDFHLN